MTVKGCYYNNSSKSSLPLVKLPFPLDLGPIDLSPFRERENKKYENSYISYKSHSVFQIDSKVFLSLFSEE